MTTTRRIEIREFLRARRRALSPETFGLPQGKRRRIAGLRREELAALAGVGVTWYTWLEQGREIRVSADTLERIARVLRLSPSDTMYLFALCELPPPTIASIAPGVPPAIVDVLDAFHGPALVIGPTTDILAANAFAEALYDFDAFPDPLARNLLGRSALAPFRRRFYVNFDEGLRNVVGFFRITYARHAGESRFEELLATLLERSPEFMSVWNDRRTNLAAPALLLCIQSDQFGRMNFHSVRFAIPDLPEHLVFFGASADDATRAIVDRWWETRARK